MLNHKVIITPNEVILDGKTLDHTEQGGALLTEL